ncbi:MULTISPECIES: DUF6571 family protein [unclassified Actinomyces]|uniref:DUF6571 family protein n=1 Tax=unclassified Actinomyces TaxID=2609248 RepID=UPI000DD071DD|nr:MULTISPECIES: DUF6571 family protein [unclassified Actinomyces]
MAVVILNADKLATAIQDLRDFSNSCAAAVTSIDNKCADEHDPMDLSDFRTDARGAIDCVRSRADDLENAKDAIVAVNESGVGSMNAHGDISCEVPDETTINTIDDLAAWSQATIDAHDLQTVTGPYMTKSNGRSYSQIIEAIRGRSDDPAYAAALINAIGPENLTQLPLDVASNTHVASSKDNADELADLLGVLLASASTRWDDDMCESMATTIAESVDGVGEWGRITVLNAIVGGHDADDDHVSDLEFNSTFLNALADNLEEIDWNTVRSVSATRDIQDAEASSYARQRLGSYLDGHSFDPLSGVLYAMGNNPEAALMYLSADGEIKYGQWEPGKQAETRWEMLSTRYPGQSNGLNVLTATMASASSMRGSEDSGKAAAATWVISRSMEFAYDVPFDDYTDTMKENLSVVIANTSDQGLKIADGGSPEGLDLHTDGNRDYTDTDLYTTLIYRVIDNEVASTTIYTAFTDAALEDHSNVEDASSLKSKYHDAGTVYGYLNAIGSVRLTDLEDAATAEHEAAEKAIGLGFTLATTIVGGPKPPWSYRIGSTVAKPLVDLVASDELPEFDDPLPNTRTTLETQAYAEAVNQGLITDPDAFNPEYCQDEYTHESYTWCVTNDDGTTSFNLDVPPTDDQNDQVHNWATDIKRDDHDPDNIIIDTETAIDTGINRGQARILGEDGAKGEAGAIEIKKD